MVCLMLPALASACLPTPTPTPTATPTATATITPTTTATVIWFPPTVTFTPLPTRPVEPTVDTRPSFGDELFNDPFNDTSLWQTTRTAAGSVAYGKGELTLAVSQPQGSLLSLRKAPQLSNFYLEVSVQPSLCRGSDAFGLLIRAASAADYYRLLLNCNGQMRMERIMNSRTTPLNEWVTSGQLLPGGMLQTRLGVAAQGQELSVFVNDVFQFSVKDPVFESGAAGVFARSAGETPLTVNFSDMVVYEIGARPPATVTPSAGSSATAQP